MSDRDRELDIDPDIRRARTLPAWFYRSQEVHEWLRERVLARSWQIVAHESQLRLDEDGQGEALTPGAWPLRFLPGSVDEPLLLTRDDRGALRCLSNVCTHRAATVLEAPCAGDKLRCPYHGRRFALDGRMIAAPEFEEAADFPGPSDHLPDLALVGWAGFLFTAIDPAWPFAEQLLPLAERVDHLPWSRVKLEPAGTRDYEFEANWMLYLDNYLEGLHVPYIHPGLNRRLDFAGYRTETHRWSNVQIGPPSGDEPVLPSHPDPDLDFGPSAGQYWFLFPNTLVNVYPWGMSLNIVEPLSVSRTRVRFQAWVWSPELYGEGAGSGLDEVELEDEAMTLRAQSGVNGRLYHRGRYAPTREQGLHHFHRLLAELWRKRAARLVDE
jgi:choline monooxygenase